MGLLPSASTVGICRTEFALGLVALAWIVRPDGRCKAPGHVMHTGFKVVLPVHEETQADKRKARSW